MFLCIRTLLLKTYMILAIAMVKFGVCTILFPMHAIALLITQSDPDPVTDTNGKTEACIGPMGPVIFGKASLQVAMSFQYEKSGFIISAYAPPLFPDAGEKDANRIAYINKNWNDFKTNWSLTDPPAPPAKPSQEWKNKLTAANVEADKRLKKELTALKTGSYECTPAAGVYEGTGEPSYVCTLGGDIVEQVEKEGERLRAAYYQDSFLFYGVKDTADSDLRPVTLYFGAPLGAIPLGKIKRYTASEWTAQKSVLASAGRCPLAYTSVKEDGQDITYGGPTFTSGNVYMGTFTQIGGKCGEATFSCAGSSLQFGPKMPKEYNLPQKYLYKSPFFSR